MINRTYDIDFNSNFKTDSFIEDEVVRSIIKKRDLIISSVLKFVSREILPDLERRRDFITILKKQYKNHAKNRTDEYLALLMLMLEKILKYIPYYDPEDFGYGLPGEDEKAIRTAWIDYQNAKAKDTETSSNSIVKLLDGLVREYMQMMKDIQSESHKDYPDEAVFIYTHKEYQLEMVKTKSKIHCAACHKLKEGDGLLDEICECQGEQTPEVYSRAFFEFTAQSSEIVHAFDRFCRNNGIKNPYETDSIFGARLKNDKHILKKTGCELVVKEPKNDPYFRIVRGRRFYKFRKAIIR